MPTVKFMQINDIHTSDHPPVNRTDTYTDDIFRKLESCFQLAEDVGVHVVLMPGDLFHNPQPTKVSHELVNRWLELLDWGLGRVHSVVAIPGNHDLSAGRVESVGRQPISALKSMPGFTLLMPGQRERVKDGVVVGGYPYESGSTPERISEVMKAHGGKIDILMLHASVLVKPTPHFYSFSPAELVADLAANAITPRVICYGHMHEPVKAGKHGTETWVSNPGSLSRGALTKTDLQRMPQVSVFSYETDSRKVTMEYVDVPGAKQPADIFRIMEAEIMEANDEAVSHFINELAIVDFEGISVEQLIAKAKELALETKVGDLAADILFKVA